VKLNHFCHDYLLDPLWAGLQSAFEIRRPLSSLYQIVTNDR
jgi:hypothetical protein